MEDLESVLSESGLQVVNLEEKGRCLFTAEDFYPGQVILKQDPYVCVPSYSDATTSRCDGCFASHNLKKCSGCQVVWYCGSACQKSEWTLHKLECYALSRIEMEKRKKVTPSIRLMLRLYIRRKLQSEKMIPTCATDNYDLMEALISHMEDTDEKRLLLYAQTANLVHFILKWPDINLKEITNNFSKLACNAHTICDSELRPLGTGLYPVVSLINHSCLPNAVLTFDGSSAVVRAVQHIPKNVEISISYIDTAGSTMTRQKALKDQYFFICACLRCIKAGQCDDIKESAILEGYRCKDDSCGGFLLRDSDDKGFICQQCGLLRSKEEVKKIATDVRMNLDMIPESISSSNLKEAVCIYEKSEELQKKLCHPFSISLMRTREELLKVLMKLEDWSKALEYCRLNIPVYQRVYPEFHPSLGLQYYTCGKLAWLLGYTEDAIKSYTKAVDVLQVTHGTNATFVKELVMNLEEAHAEASYKLSFGEL